MKIREKGIAFVILAAAVYFVDHAAKQLAVDLLSGGLLHSYLGDFLRLEFAQNTGVILGLGSQLPEGIRSWLLPGVTAVILVLITFLLIREPGFGPAAAGLSLVWGGGFANLVDRVIFGRVVDFFTLGIGEVRTGVSNLADVAIVIGIPLIVIGWWIQERMRRQDQEPAAPGAPEPP